MTFIAWFDATYPKDQFPGVTGDTVRRLISEAASLAWAAQQVIAYETGHKSGYGEGFAEGLSQGRAEGYNDGVKGYDPDWHENAERLAEGDR